jgi:hypothetical protein
VRGRGRGGGDQMMPRARNNAARGGFLNGVMNALMGTRCGRSLGPVGGVVSVRDIVVVRLNVDLPEFTT